MMQKTVLLLTFLWMAAVPAMAQTQAVDDQGQNAKQAWGRDPFVTSSQAGPAALAPTQSGYWLKGILIRGERKTAVINDSFIKEGEQAAGIRVLKIEPEQVTLEKNGKKMTLKVGEHES